MTDSVSITPGVGADIAVDEIGGLKFQRIKLIHGADGANDGDVAASNPLPVISYRTEQLLGQLVQATISPPTYDSALRRQRVTAVVESGTVTTVSTVTTLSDQTNIGSRPALMLITQTNLSAWADCVRARIT
jgi:hypothetical protein